MKWLLIGKILAAFLLILGYAIGLFRLIDKILDHLDK